MAEVGGYNEKVVLVEPGREGLVQIDELVEFVGGDDDGHDGRHLLQVVLQEGDLHLQTMFAVMGTRVILEKLGIPGSQLAARLGIDGHFAERRGIVGDGSID